MKNLNKYTKDQLIKQYKELEKQNNNQTLIIKIINTLLYFKSLLLKLTLITLLIKWIRKYSLVKKLWHIFAIIGNSLLGFSLFDLYSLDVISWIKDTSIYKWYDDLFSKPELPNETRVSKDRQPISKWIINETTRIQSESKIDNENISENLRRNYKQEIVNKDELENEYNYRKYFIIGSLIIISGIVYYYWNDIKPAAGDAGNSLIEKIRSFRSWFSGNENNIINNNPGNNTINIPTNVNTPIEASEALEDIQLVDNNPPNYEQSIKKGKAVLTSASLENLNNQAESSWSSSSSSNEGISSPSSDDSSSTITPDSITKTNETNVLSNLIKNEWRSKLTSNINDKINFIESSLLNISETDIGLQLTDYFAFIINEYNKNIETYNFMKSSSNYTIEDLSNMKESLYYFREWIAEYQTKIFPTSNVTIEIGSINDSPKILTKNIV